MGSVHSLAPYSELDKFFEFMYQDQEGYAYMATLDPDTRTFTQYFYGWPTEKDALIRNVQHHSPTLEVYYGPGLYGRKEATKEAFLGTHFVWCEFDGSLPESTEDIPEPSLRIRSSDDNHEHWYWRLEGFVRDKDVIERITERLAYRLEADHCWNANRVLRPPHTIHHESQKTVTVLRWDDRPVPIEVFANLPELPVRTFKAEDIYSIPDIADVILKFAFPEEAKDLFRAKVESGKNNPKSTGRSGALFKMACFCIEIGMSNAEALAVLFNCDKRWGKFSKRPDQKARLVDIINKARLKHPVNVVEKEIDSAFRVYTLEEFMNTEIKIDWLIKGFLHQKGLLSISGLPGVGKSQMSLRLMEKLAKGDKFLQWRAERPIKTMFISLEMVHEELLEFLQIMGLQETANEISENFLVLPVGHGMKLSSTNVRNEIDKLAQKFQPDGIIIDSFGRSVLEDISSDKIVLDVMEYVDRILRKEFGCWVGFVHHMRKPQIGNKKPNKLEDLFGSQYYGASVTSAINMHEVGNAIEFDCLKMRMAQKFKGFRIRRTPRLDFEVIEGMSSPSKKSSEPIFGDDENTGLAGSI